MVTCQPISNNVPLEGSITLTCRANVLGILGYYSWERRSSGSSWTTVSNDNTTSYTTDTTLAIGQHMYRCRVRNKVGSVVSNVATVNVYGEYFPDMYVMTQVCTGRPTIKFHPMDKLIIVNTTTSLSCIANGCGIITYQWHKRSLERSTWIMISNNNNSVLVTEKLQESTEFRCSVSNEVGSSRSHATITVLSKESQCVKAGGYQLLKQVYMDFEIFHLRIY